VRVFLLDNYDSFTWNLVHAVESAGGRVTVERNDGIAPGRIAAEGFDRVILSPGPGRPDAAGRMPALLERIAGRVPVLGVCLGHQAIGRLAGRRVLRAPRLMHGKTSPVHHDGKGIFRGLPDPFPAMRYHSLVVDPADVADDLEVSAWTADGVVMGVRHRRWPIEGVQFHPESILTPDGPALIANFLAGA
jgi:anthranilate synthase/aminodeoxychorismate synthase-like glutamine amidotransferase